MSDNKIQSMIGQMHKQMEQMKQMASQNQAPELVKGAADPSNSINAFGQHLNQAINNVNELQMESAALSTDFQLGKEGVELPQVMLSMQKSSVAFQAAVEVRNKMVNAYQEIMNMPV
jgi:flagellar hook-basal body complex protein FliE